MIGTLWSRWCKFWAPQETGTTLALIRMALACVMLATLYSVARVDLMQVIWVDAKHGGMRSVAAGGRLVQLLGGPTPAVVNGLYWTAVLSGLSMFFGLGGRWTVLIAWQSYRALSGIGYSNGGYDSMIGNAAWMLVLGAPTASLSLDCLLKHRRLTDAKLVASWPRRILVLQLVVIYTMTGLQKTSASWFATDGYSALYWFLQDPTWIRHDTAWTVDWYWLTQAATAMTWHFETAAPLLLLWYYLRRRPTTGRFAKWAHRLDWRKPFALFGVSMHLGIAWLMNMGPFSFISLSYYLALVRPHEWERLWRRLRPPSRLSAAKS